MAVFLASDKSRMITVRSVRWTVGSPFPDRPRLILIGYIVRPAQTIGASPVVCPARRA